jgi:PAS domain S-box-containing protein
LDQTAGRMLEFIAEHTSDVFIRVDASGVVTYASPSIRTYGYTPEDIVGTTGLQLIHPDDRSISPATPPSC